MVSKGRLAERSEQTRAALLAAARPAFAAHGYAAASIEEIAAAAGVTKGAVYHHFGGKEQLFRAVYERMEADLAQRSARAAAGEVSPLEMARRGLAAFLDACLEQDVQRIVLHDALSVLGWTTWHEVGEAHTFGMLRGVLAAAAQSGEIVSAQPEALAHLLQGALMRAGLVVARADDPATARRQVGQELDLLLDAVRRPS